MTFFILQPEVAGSKGEHTLQDRSVHPPKVTRLHYEFDGWLGDDILETIACFITTKRLAEQLQNMRVTGVEFDDVEITTSEQFGELFQDTKLPPFVWLKIKGKPGKDDFGLSKEHQLVVSEQVQKMLKQLNLNHCDVAEFKG